MAKKKEVEEKSTDQIWVYPGERRPVVVEAKNERHAKDKVRKSPAYDGFPVYVFPVMKFISKCAPTEDVPVPTGDEKKIDDSKVYISIKAVGGKIQEVKVYSDGTAVKRDSDKIAEHLDKAEDELSVFVIENHQEIGENEFIEAKKHYVATEEKKVKEVKEEKKEIAS